MQEMLLKRYEPHEFWKDVEDAKADKEGETQQLYEAFHEEFARDFVRLLSRCSSKSASRRARRTILSSSSDRT
jgi:hypothetical protein